MLTTRRQALTTLTAAAIGSTLVRENYPSWPRRKRARTLRPPRHLRNPTGPVSFFRQLPYGYDALEPAYRRCGNHAPAPRQASRGLRQKSKRSPLAKEPSLAHVNQCR